MKVKIDVEAKENDTSKIDCYKISFQLAGDIEVSKKLYESDMKELLDNIIAVLGYKPIMEKFNCTIKEAQEIRKKIDKDYDCKDCDLKLFKNTLTFFSELITVVHVNIKGDVAEC